MNNREINSIIVGRIGLATKVIILKESEFKKELAPATAIVDHVEINKERCVKMTY